MDESEKTRQRCERRRQLNADRQRQNEGIYRLIYKEAFSIVAYERIKSAPGTLTPGSDSRTIDGFSLQMIRQIIEEMRTEPLHFKPVRIVFIPKPNGKMRKLGIPIGLSYCLSFPAMFGIPMVASGVNQKPQPTRLVLRSHVLLRFSSLTRFPVLLRRLAKLRDAFWGERNPAWSMGSGLHTLQTPGFTPRRNRCNMDVEQDGRSSC